MKIKSPAFEENQLIPSSYTCDGDNTNPPLEISDIPSGTKSLAIIMDDPDAATDPDGPGKTFDHWFIWNIPPTVTKIEKGIVPQDAIQGLNGAGKVGYTGACPPNGTHRYFIKLYALNRKLNISPEVSKEELERELENGLIGKSELVGLYKREK